VLLAERQLLATKVPKPHFDLQSDATASAKREVRESSWFMPNALVDFLCSCLHDRLPSGNALPYGSLSFKGLNIEWTFFLV
jgi:hypothetical protein